MERKIDTALVEFLGEPILQVLLSSDSVFCYLIDPDDTTATKPKIGGFTVFEKGGKLTYRNQETLTNILTTTDNYGLDNIRKNCLFTPGIAFEFFYKKDKLQVLVCLDCDEWRFILNGDEKNYKHEDCDPARPALIRLAKKLFPKDPLIKQLK